MLAPWSGVAVAGVKLHTHFLVSAKNLTLMCAHPDFQTFCYPWALTFQFNAMVVLVCWMILISARPIQINTRVLYVITLEPTKP